MFFYQVHMPANLTAWSRNESAALPPSGNATTGVLDSATQSSRQLSIPAWSYKVALLGSGGGTCTLQFDATVSNGKPICCIGSFSCLLFLLVCSYIGLDVSFFSCFWERPNKFELLQLNLVIERRERMRQILYRFL